VYPPVSLALCPSPSVAYLKTQPVPSRVCRKAERSEALDGTGYTADATDGGRPNAT